MTGKHGSVWDRFWSKVDVSDGCWEWLASRDPNGYGHFNVKPRVPALAHRLAFEFLRGPIPKGLQIDHLCRVRHCVNPFHLEPVTRRENILRGESPAADHARKTHCPKGHPYDEANTYRTNSGGRLCRACHRDGERTRRASNSA